MRVADIRVTPAGKYGYSALVLSDLPQNVSGLLPHQIQRARTFFWRLDQECVRYVGGTDGSIFTHPSPVMCQRVAHDFAEMVQELGFTAVLEEN